MFTQENKPQEAKKPDTEFEQNEIIIDALNDIDNDTPVDIENNISGNTSNQDFDKDKPVDISGNQDSLTGVMSLLKQVVEDGLAVVLEDSHLDADLVYAKAVTFSKSALPGSTFRQHRLKKVETIPSEKKEDKETVGDKVVTVSVHKKGGKNTTPRTRKKENYLDIAPQPTLRVDELAKLLS